MRTIWLSLAWKEWHEHKWKLASLLAILWSMAFLWMRHNDPDWRLFLSGVRVILVMCIVPLAIFIGLGTAAGERSRGTLPFLQALPVPMWRVALHKVFFGLATLVSAALLTMAFVNVWCRFRDVTGIGYRTAATDVSDVFSLGANNWFSDTALVMVCVAASFYIWTIACGVNRRDEVSAGAIALLFMVIWTVFISFGLHWLLDRSSWVVTRYSAMRLMTVALSTAPGGLVTTTQMAWNFLGFGIVAASITHIGLAAWYVRRFGRITNLEVRSPQVAKPSVKASDWLGPPRRSPFSAVAWKQFRECGPIVTAGLAGTIGITAFVLLADWIGSDSPTTHAGEIYNAVAMVYNAVAIVLGFVMALVIGIGVCHYDVQPQLNTFWRSRPVHPDLWFWCKFITGLAVLMTAIYAPILLIAALGDTSALKTLNYPDAYVLPVAHVAVFASAVAMTCLVRHAVYAAILSIGFMYLGVLVAICAWFGAGLVGWAEPNPDIWWEPTLMQGASGLMTSVVFSTVIAWLAMRYDWGRKSRY